jgi:hypothetical protein
LTDPELIAEIGDDSIAFTKENGCLVNCNRVPEKHRAVVEIGESLIREFLGRDGLKGT